MGDLNSHLVRKFSPGRLRAIFVEPKPAAAYNLPNRSYIGCGGGRGRGKRKEEEKEVEEEENEVEEEEKGRGKRGEAGKR